ncbi:MAG: branched-chain amino acid transport system II carrier protein [Eubacteriales bacterium]|nr:branched-chain amino acid transport system II carrier protein [Eubacteriales bacterium]MDY3333008.1 branched-chain amino acid transport system II carrier protein [Gallibacter sp.]
MQKNMTKDMIVVGFALFAIFFGAGNLIFPPYLGVVSGDGWVQSTIGFLITDPVFPLIGMIATAMVGGMADDLGKRVSPVFSKFLGIVSILTIGPFFAVPRTAATTHEVFTVQVFGNGAIDSVAPWITSLIFFAASFFFVINPTKVIDYIGKILTPLLLIILIGTIIVAIFNPAGEALALHQEGLFKTGFYEGYQTMDALGAALMSGIALTDLINKGYTDRKDQFKAIVGASLIAAVLLFVVYGGLLYVGSTVSGQFQAEAAAGNRTAILVGMFVAMFGAAGKWAIGIAVTLACLTTSVGLTGMAGNFISRVLGKSGDLKTYKIIVSVSIVISFFLSVFGVTKLINFAVPILAAIYPIYMILFVVTLFDSKIKYNWTYTGAVIMAAVISIPTGIITFCAINGVAFDPATGFTGVVGTMNDLLNKIPLADLGLNWIVPGICGLIVGMVLQAVTGKGKTREN